MTRAQKQCVTSLEGQSVVSRFPYSPCDPLTFQQHAAHCFAPPSPSNTSSQTLPSFPHWALGFPCLTEHEQ